MQTDVYIKIINEKMNMEFWMSGFLVIPKVYAVIASPFRNRNHITSVFYSDRISSSKNILRCKNVFHKIQGDQYLNCKMCPTLFPHVP